MFFMLLIAVSRLLSLEVFIYLYLHPLVIGFNFLEHSFFSCIR